MPAGSKTDPPLAKAEPISNSGSTSGIMHLRRGKNPRSNCSQREEREYVREATLQTPRSMKKEGEDMLQAQEQRLPCSLWRLTVEQTPICSP
ncbi:hypothetical protein llap_213 [Limosa lapponica baueri]|uniref:Uncharacterized protein n=1 Tax=Limosa lapponica baueri TaxID=1758121 RepID=A0A2I0UTW9_LIMLA|nr:hypothetical protein llap_213 [Limosa lapponica baueri]